MANLTEILKRIGRGAGQVATTGLDLGLEAVRGGAAGLMGRVPKTRQELDAEARTAGTEDLLKRALATKYQAETGGTETVPMVKNLQTGADVGMSYPTAKASVLPQSKIGTFKGEMVLPSGRIGLPPFAQPETVREAGMDERARHNRAMEEIGRQRGLDPTELSKQALREAQNRKDYLQAVGAGDVQAQNAILEGQAASIISRGKGRTPAVSSAGGVPSVIPVNPVPQAKPPIVVKGGIKYTLRPNGKYLPEGK